MQDIETRNSPFQCIETNFDITAVKLDSTATALAIGDCDSKVVIHDAETEQKIRTISAHTQRVTAMDWSDTTPYLVTSGSSDGLIINHDVRQRHSAINILEGHEGQLTNIRYFNRNQLVTTSHEDAVMAVWDCFLTSPSCESTELESPIRSLDCAGDKLVTCSNEIIQMWRGSENLHQLKCASNVTSVLWNSDSSEVVSTHDSARHEIKLWQVDKVPNRKESPYWFTKVKDFGECHQDSVIRTCLSPSGEHVCAVAADETISLWRLFDKKRRQTT